MAEKTEAKAAEPKRYIATEDCLYKGRYLKRGELIILEENPSHACLIPYTGKALEEKDLGYFDPIDEAIQKDRMKSAMASFM